MAKHILIDRGDGTATLVRSAIETAGENPLTHDEILINELYNKVKNLGLADVSQCVPMQKCPKCDGQGIVSKPPWIAGDQHTWDSSTSANHQCDVCNGQKIIPMVAHE